MILSKYHLSLSSNVYAWVCIYVPKLFPYIKEREATPKQNLKFINKQTTHIQVNILIPSIDDKGQSNCWDITICWILLYFGSKYLIHILVPLLSPLLPGILTPRWGAGSPHQSFLLISLHWFLFLARTLALLTFYPFLPEVLLTPCFLRTLASSSVLHILVLYITYVCIFIFI